jgi:electron transport complex protein RnfB
VTSESRPSATTAAIDALLPQTQCTRCGYDACLPYAAAIANDGENINRCPPGGSATIARLAQLLQRPWLDLDPTCGVEAPATVAWIDPQICIGCARCLPPCPTDAIIGAQKLLHTIIDELCTGCELCIAACPVDCIHMRARTTPEPTAADNRLHFASHLLRHERQAAAKQAAIAAHKRAARDGTARDS